MFTCSICDDTFSEVPTALCTTLCGHIFHSGCIIQWLERKQNCPQCRATVLQNDLIKLFLEDNPNARASWNTLNVQLEKSHEREQNYEKLNTQLQNELLKTRTKAAEDLAYLNIKCKNNDKMINDLHIRIASFNLDYIHLKEHTKCTAKKYALEQIKYRSLEKDLQEMQSVKNNVIDQLNAEVAYLKSEKAYLQNKCHSLEKGNELSSTSEVHRENEYRLSHDNTIQNTFYGHDPKLTLSPKKFLLGCVFLFIEDGNQFEDICSDVFMLKLSIIEHGGLVEVSYSFRVTHLICVTQKHHLVEQGVRDGKRCVTSYWLSDIISKKCMLPPWLAYHFPLPYSDASNLPCQQFQIAITNFEQNEYHIVNAMVKLIGAHVLNTISLSTNIVVSRNLDGDMINTAFAMKKPVVNVQWLNDILFGAINGITYPENIKYQQFSLSDPFSVNYDMVSNLMEAWKLPVIKLQDTKVHDLTESSDGPSTYKRQKTNSVEPEVIDLDDEDSNDVIITYVGTVPKHNPCVILCGFEVEEEEELKKIVLGLGGIIASNCQEGTHLVMKKPAQTQLFLSCLTTIKYIVEEIWLRISLVFNRFEDANEYRIDKIYDDSNGYDCEVICDVKRVLQNPERQQLFAHKTFFITPGIEFPTSESLEQIIKSAGGTVEKQIKNVHSMKDILADTYFIISCYRDLHLIKEHMEMRKYIYRSDFVTNAVMQQSINVNQNLLLM